MLYESRIYKAVPGRLPDINARFANHTVGFFRQYEIGMLGFWTDEIGASNQLTYILSFDSLADRAEKWAAFQSDQAWAEVRAETEANGPIVAQVVNTFMSLTPYSPPPQFATAVQELRVYDAMPGKLPRPPQPLRQPHYGAVRETRHRKRGLLDGGCRHQQPAGVYAGLPRFGRPGKELGGVPSGPGLANRPRRVGGKGASGSRIHAFHPAPYPLLASLSPPPHRPLPLGGGGGPSAIYSELIELTNNAK